MVTLYHDAADATASRYPDIVVLILGDTADVIVAETLLFGQIVQVIVLKVQNVQTFAGTDPQQATRVLQHLGDEVVRKRLVVCYVTCQHFFLGC